MGIMSAVEKVYIRMTGPLDGMGIPFNVINVEGEEYLSRPFTYKIKVISANPAEDMAAMISEEVTVFIESGPGTFRWICGKAVEFSQMDTGEIDADFSTEYNLVLKPWFWILTLTKDCKVFQNLTVKEIIEEVFGGYSFSEFRFALTGTYEPRIYCVQYNESAFDFVSRLMESEGIFYYFEHTDAGHTMVIADSLDVFEPAPLLASVKIKPSEGSWGDEGFIQSCSFEQRVIPNKYSMNDYNFETPDTSLLTSVAGVGLDLENYDHAGKYSQTAQGEAIAQKRLEAIELNEKTLSGISQCRGFSVGSKFGLANHTRADLNTNYVIKKLTINASQKQYLNNFEAFFADTEYRPELKTPKPKIPGSQTALVVGKEGEEIWCDLYGRIKLQFYWDRIGTNNEDSSFWVRVAQTWAGKAWGSLYTPRMNAEAVVSFYEGDPDKPLLVATQYNASQVLPYELPLHKAKSVIKTLSTKEGDETSNQGNELTFKDNIDEENIYMHAQKDMNTKVENDCTLYVDRDISIDVRGYIQITGRTIRSEAYGNHIYNNASLGINNLGISEAPSLSDVASKKLPGIHYVSNGPITYSTSDESDEAIANVCSLAGLKLALYLALPSFTLPNLALPGLTAPDIDFLKQFLPSMDLPDFKLPSISMPGFDCPSFEGPDFSLPDLTLPDITVPNIDLSFGFPEIDFPSIMLPDFDLPDFFIPDLGLPEFSLPDFDIPEVKLPKISKPEFKLPDYKFPGIKLPKFKKPDLEMPDFEWMDVDLPGFKLPKFSFGDISLDDFGIPEFLIPDYGVADLPDVDIWPDIELRNLIRPILSVKIFDFLTDIKVPKPGHIKNRSWLGIKNQALIAIGNVTLKKENNEGDGESEEDLGITTNAHLGISYTAGLGMIYYSKKNIIYEAKLLITNLAGLHIKNKAKKGMDYEAKLAVLNVAGGNIKNKAQKIISKATLGIINMAGKDLKNKAGVKLTNQATLAVLDIGSAKVAYKGAIVKVN